MKKLLLLFILIIFISGGFIYFSRNNNTETKTSDNEKIKLKFGSLPLSLNLPLYIAEKEKLFEKNGLEVEIVQFQDGLQIINAIYTNKLDAGLASIPIILSAQTTTKEIKIKTAAIQIEVNNNPIYELVVSKSLNSIGDLNGKKIGYFPPTPTTKYFLESLLESRSVKSEIIQFAPSTIVAAFESGEIDAIFSTAPFTTLAMKKNLGNVIEKNKAIVAENLKIEPLPAGAYILSNDYIKNNPVVAGKVILSLDQAIDFMRKNPKKARQAWEFYLPEQQKSLIPVLPMPAYWKSDEVDIKKIQALQQWLLNKELLDTKTDINSLLIKP